MTAQDPDDIRARNVRFREEIQAFRFVYRCSDCAHEVRAVRPGPASKPLGACSLGYPNARLRHSDNAVEADGTFIFCKYFEPDA